MPIAVPDYKAPSWCPGAHLQTVIPAKFMPRPTVEYRREKVELPDGDFMLWDWVVPEPVEPAAPVLVHFHGLEGSSRSHYAEALMGGVRRSQVAGCRGAFQKLRRRDQSLAARILCGRQRRL